MENREAKLVEAAIRTFVRFGARKTTMSDIAEEAGVSRQTLYTSYRNKDEMLAASILYSSRQLLDAAREKWAGLESLEDKLEAYFEHVVVAAFEMIKHSPDAEVLIRGQDETSRAAIKTAHEMRCEALNELLAPFEDRINQSGLNLARFTYFIVMAAVGFKYSAESKSDLRNLLASLKASVLNVTGNQSRKY